MKKLIILGFMLINSFGLAQNLDSGLVAYFPFNGDAKDMSGNGNNGVVHGANLVNDRCGNTNNAYYFNGIDNYIEVFDSPSLNIQNSISIVAWFKTNEPSIPGSPGNDPNGYIISKHQTHKDAPGTRSYILGMGSSSGNSIFGSLDDLNDLDRRATTSNLGNIYFDDNWHFIAFTYNKENGHANIIIDCKIILDTLLGQFDLRTCIKSVLIGCYFNSDGSIGRGWFHGTLDNIRLYNRTLTKVEIDLIRNYECKFDCCFIKPLNIKCNNQSICKGDSTLLQVEPYNTNYKYNWLKTKDSTSVFVSDSSFVFVSDSGYYYIKVLDTLNGCSDTVGIWVEVKPRPVANIIGSKIICKGDSVLLKVEPFSSNYTYEWSNMKDSSTIFVSDSSSIFVSDSGYFNIKVTDNQSGCSDSAGIWIDVIPKPEVNIVGARIICKGDTIILQAIPDSSNYKYKWSNGKDSSSIFVSDSGYYNVIVSDKQSGCSDSMGIWVDVRPKPEVNIMGSKIICKGDSVLLKAEPFSSNYTYEWSNGKDSSSIFVSDSGYYNVIVSDKQSGCSDSVGVWIEVKPKPEVNIVGARIICKGDTIKLQAIPESSNYTYEWSNSKVSSSISVSDSGYYNVIVTDKQSGCRDSMGIRVDVKPKPEVNINGSKIICKGDTIKLQAIPDSSNFTYEWSNGKDSSSIFVSDSGYYYVIVTDKQFGCSDSIGIWIDLELKPKANIRGSNIICKGDTVLLQVEPFGSNYTYEWSNGKDSSSIFVSDSGYYYVKVFNKFGCYDSVGIHIKINPKPIASVFGIQSICKGDTIKLQAKPDSSNYTYEWSNGKDSSSIFVADSGYYLVKVTNQFGCSDTVGIKVDLKPTIQIKIDTIYAEIGENNVIIEVNCKLINFSKKVLNNLKFHLSIDASVFFPDTCKSKFIDNYIDKFDQRHLILEYNNLNLKNNDQISFQIYGMTLLGDYLISKIHILECISKDWDICVDSTSGYLVLDTICALNLRHIQFFTPTTFSVKPNPANSNEIEIYFEGDEEGLHTFNFFNIQGIKIDSKEWINSKKGKKDFKFHLNDYPNGVYYVVLKSPWNVISKPLVVIK